MKNSVSLYPVVPSHLHQRTARKLTTCFSGRILDKMQIRWRCILFGRLGDVKNGLHSLFILISASKICRRLPLKNFTWVILEYCVQYNSDVYINMHIFWLIMEFNLWWSKEYLAALVPTFHPWIQNPAKFEINTISQ